MFGDTLPESVIKRLSIRARELGAANLGQGIPSFPTAPHIIEAAKLSLDDPKIGIYPNFLGEIELREAISARIKAEYNLKISPEKEILVTIGAMEGTASAILTLTGNGDNVGIITPDYCNHFPQVALARGEIIEIPMIEDGKWRIDRNNLEKVAKKLELLIITNPNNPTGAILSAEDLMFLVNLSQQYGFYIIADETYAFLHYDNEFNSLFKYWGLSDRLIVVRTFSKEYAMTGWRVGYVVSVSQMISAASRVHDALVGTAAKISQRAAIAALKGPQKVVADYQKILKRRRDLAYQLLNEAKDVLTFAKPEGAYYVFPKYQQQVFSKDLSEKLLAQAKVAVVPGAIFGAGGKGHLRISFAVDDEVLIEGIKRIISYLRKNK